MERKRILLLLGIALAVSGCAVSNERIVTRMAARETACDKTKIEVTELDQDYAGISRYQTNGCGSTNNYHCDKWSNVMIASLGWIALDPRPCHRERR